MYGLERGLCCGNAAFLPSHTAAAPTTPYILYTVELGYNVIKGT
jgi:hypothetical protein